MGMKNKFGQQLQNECNRHPEHDVITAPWERTQLFYSGLRTGKLQYMGVCTMDDWGLRHHKGMYQKLALERSFKAENAGSIPVMPTKVEIVRRQPFRKGLQNEYLRRYRRDSRKRTR